VVEYSKDLLTLSLGSGQNDAVVVSARHSFLTNNMGWVVSSRLRRGSSNKINFSHQQTYLLTQIISNQIHMAFIAEGSPLAQLDPKGSFLDTRFSAVSVPERDDMCKIDDMVARGGSDLSPPTPAHFCLFYFLHLNWWLVGFHNCVNAT